jgi:hypothetical protein
MMPKQQLNFTSLFSKTDNSSGIAVQNPRGTAPDSVARIPSIFTFNSMQLQQLQLALLSSIITLSLKHIKKKIHIFYSLSHTADFYAICHIARFGSGKRSNVILTRQGESTETFGQ